MKINDLIEELKKNPEISNAGMILTHTGIVRNSSRDGKKIKTLDIEPDFSLIENIVNSNKKLPGIIDIKFYMHEKATLNIGDEIMHIAIAGDIRENTIYAMSKTLNEIKEKAVKKKQNLNE
ncbi:MAG: molybdenum cofactor biosynthesis protein MoaE [Desulforegulaceae bacterium]|jgi:molybdopterin synthase catalytic subunit|nr:molybdenum cofactor biosynthesis protein MoaE [Desulforegulaceae bacterium]